jgi:hypothetical protein
MKRKRMLLLSGGMWLLCLVPALSQSDITNLGGTASAQYTDSPAGEGIAMVIDNQSATKYLTFHNAGWIQFQAASPYVVTRYSITSANDAPERDALSWTLQGSSNGATWTTLNTQSNQDFPTRLQRREFTFTNTTAYTHYRLQLTNNSGTILQVAEWELFGVPSGGTNVATVFQHTNYGGTSGALPVGSYTLSQLQARGIADNWVSSVRVTAGYRITFYENDNFGGATLSKTADDATLVDDSWNDRATSVRVEANTCGSFPDTWQEHWFEHNLVVSKVFNDCDVAIYYDNDMDRSITWIQQYVGDAWRYTKNLYGDMSGGTGDGRLFGIYHANKFGGGHPGYYYDAGHDNRNVIDLGQTGSWAQPTGWSLDATIHEIGHIVESTTHNAQGSPAFPIWGDSKWCVIYQYDVYVNVGWASEATRWYNQQINDAWFRDWFYPIWRDRGRGAALKKFFQLLSQYFPKNGKRYTRDMNWGEFVHFWSGAAGVNLKPLATTAFGWPADREAQFNQARIDFPFTYPDAAPPIASKAMTAEEAKAIDNAVTVWPNPTMAKKVSVEIKRDVKEATVEIFAFTGEKISETIIKGNTGEVSLERQPKGIYLMVISFEGKTVNRKIKLE